MLMLYSWEVGERGSTTHEEVSLPGVRGQVIMSDRVR